MNALMLLIVGVAAQVAADAQATATQMANATQFNVTFSGRRVSACTVTATSGNPQIDMAVCQAAQRCGNKFHSVEAMAPCVWQKREEVAAHIAEHLSKAK